MTHSTTSVNRLETLGARRDPAGRFASRDRLDGIQPVILKNFDVAYQIGGMTYASKGAAARYAKARKAKADRLHDFNAEVDRMAQEAAWQAAYENGHVL